MPQQDEFHKNRLFYYSWII